MSFQVKVVKIGDQGSKRVECDPGDTVADALEDTKFEKGDSVQLNGSETSLDTELDPEKDNLIAIPKNVSGG